MATEQPNHPGNVPSIRGSSSSAAPPPAKQVRKAKRFPSYLKPGTKCVVCAGPATGRHYNVITCEGCKAFFRRKIQKKKTLQCQRGGNCEITPSTRSSCPACRFVKCERAGMRKDSVKGDVERQVWNAIRAENRLKRKKIEVAEFLTATGNLRFSLPEDKGRDVGNVGNKQTFSEENRDRGLLEGSKTPSYAELHGN